MDSQVTFDFTKATSRSFSEERIEEIKEELKAYIEKWNTKRDAGFIEVRMYYTGWWRAVAKTAEGKGKRFYHYGLSWRVS